MTQLHDVTNWKGIPWYEAPIPRRLHRCAPWTIGWIGTIFVKRCACGAIKRDGDWLWMEKNSRRR